MSDLRCICYRKPLLAIYGTDTKSGNPFIHIKSVRNNRLMVDVVVTEGVVRICCRECLHWHVITIIKNEVRSKQEPLPASIAV